MRGIDSNVIVYALNSDLAEHEPCKELLERIAVAKEIVGIPSIVFMESYHALVYKYKFLPTEVQRRLIAILDSENVIIYNISTSTILYAFEIANQYKIGGRDSLIAASMLENNVKEIYSHDADFDKVMDIKRIDPTIETSH
ncbi:MAG: PIN domain-containing protein [Candidatus Lokiarchaeota archaeon]|nr:PIN domain-containing protein [Candidatus Lokiarchaeota archaeon]